MSETPNPLGASVLRTSLAGARFHPGALPHVAARILNEPLMIDPLKLVAVLHGIGSRIGVTGIRAEVSPTMVRRDRSQSYAVVDGIAVVQLFGSIVKRNEGGVLESSGLFSLEAFREVVATALADSAVRGILLQTDTNGGEAVGTPEMARYLFSLRDGGKPVWCAIDDAAYSAGAYLAAACERTFVTPTGGGGSIGVIGVHVDASKAYEAEGYTITPIFAGERKCDGADWAPLSAEAHARFQARVDATWDQFTADVAEFRGLSQARVKSYQAVTFHGRDLVTAQLADDVATFDEVLTAFRTRVSGVPARKQGGQRMETETKGEPGTTQAGNVVPLDQHRTALEKADADGRLAERARCKRIDGLAAIARMPKADARALATKLIDEGATLEQAQDAFTAAQEKADRLAAGGVEITGQRGEAATAPSGVTIPAMRSREEIFARRFGGPIQQKRQQAMDAVAQHVKQHGLDRSGAGLEGGF